MKQYLITQNDIIELLIKYQSGKLFKKKEIIEKGFNEIAIDFLKSKTPVEVIAEGEIICIGVLDRLRGALSFNIGKKGKLIWVEEIE